MKVSVILPTYNEESRLPYCLDQLLSYLVSQDFKYEIIVSADGCTDDTEKIANEYAVENPHIFLVTYPERLGKGGSILNAAHTASGEYLIIMDVDLAIPPTQISPALKKIEKDGVDIIYGSRYMSESKILVQPPPFRKFLGKAFNFIFRHLFSIELCDTQCGFKVIDREVLNSLSQTITIYGFGFDMDLAVKAVRHGYKIMELPVTWSHMEGSKVNSWKQAYEMGRDLFKVWFARTTGLGAPARTRGK